MHKREKNIFAAVDDAAVQRDDKGLFHIHVGQQGMTRLTLYQVNDLSAALLAVMTVAGEEPDFDEEDD